MKIIELIARIGTVVALVGGIMVLSGLLCVLVAAILSEVIGR